MKEIFLLKGLDCPNCAAKIEKEIGEADGVEFAVINLMRQTLTVEYKSKGRGEMLLIVRKIVKKFEPDVKVSEYKKEKNVGEKSRSNLTRLITGAILLVLAIMFSWTKFTSINIDMILSVIVYLLLGYDVLYKAVRNILKGSVFDENFLMSVSTLGALALSEYTEAAAVMLFYQIGEYFQSRAIEKSRKSISSLMDIRPDYVNLYRNGELVRVLPEQAFVGDIIVIKSGERIPLDCVITEGSSSVDMRALTGEAMPKSVGEGDTLLSGSINTGGVLKARTLKNYCESTVSKILETVENAAESKAKSESFITKFARYYTPAVVLCACLLAIIPPLVIGGNWSEWIRRSLVFLVISCPCALVISVPLAYFGGIGAAAKQGILIKGGNYLEALNQSETMVFDKTGTLTKGVFRVVKVIPNKSYSEEKCLLVAAAAETMSNHPIAKSIIEKYGKKIDENKISFYKELAGRGISATYDGKELLSGNEELMRESHIGYCLCDEIGTKVYVAENGSYIGCIVISDEIKEDSRITIKELKKKGIKNTVMLTGDSEAVGQKTAETLGIEKCYTQLLPNEKAEIMQRLKKELSQGKKAVFVGDGINDAPVLASADIGIAMGGIGSDAAIEAADIVIMTDEPSKLLYALKTAKKTRRIVVENISFALSVKLLFLILGAVGLSGMWLAVFADVGVALLAVLNSLRALKSKNGI